MQNRCFQDYSENSPVITWRSLVRFQLLGGVCSVPRDLECVDSKSPKTKRRRRILREGRRAERIGRRGVLFEFNSNGADYLLASSVGSGPAGWRATADKKAKFRFLRNLRKRCGQGAFRLAFCRRGVYINTRNRGDEPDVSDAED